MDLGDTVLVSSSTEQEYIMALHRHNRVLRTLCGLTVFPDVVDAAIRIQTNVRGWGARVRRSLATHRHRDVYRCFHALSTHAREERVAQSVFRIQARARGFHVRRCTVVGRAVSRVLVYSKDVKGYERKLLSALCRWHSVV